MFLVSSNWDDVDALSLQALPKTRFDHNAIILFWEDGLKRGSFLCRYEIIWTHHLDFRNLVVQWWNTPVDGAPMFNVVQKLKIIKDNMKGWNKCSFGNILDHKKSIVSKLKSI